MELAITTAIESLDHLVGAGEQSRRPDTSGRRCGAPKAKITLRQEARIQELGG
jgi:hypothetical protein